MKRLLPLALLGAACATPAGGPGSTPAPSPTTTATASTAEGAPEGEAAAGIENVFLAKVLTEHWAYTMASNPTWATQLGDHRYDDRIEDKSLAAQAADLEKTQAFLLEAKAITERSLKPRERIVRALFVEHLEGVIASEACHFSEWSLSPRGNPVTEWSYLPELHPMKTTADGDNLLKRFAAVPASIDTEIANLQSGVGKGWFANRESVRRVLEMVDRALAQPVKDWAMAKPAVEPPAEWPAAYSETFSKALMQTLESGVKPALVRYRDFVKQSILPKSRGEKETGVGALPFGQACYQARIEHFTTVKYDAKTHHEIGMKEIARINAEMAKLGAKLFGTKDLESTLKTLREDPKLHFDTAENLQKAAQGALDRARAAIPKYFGILPKADCIVQPIPDYEAPYTTIAYYRQPAPDGSKPGEYFINLYQPTTRPRYELEALSFHEAIPGHHLQIAIAQERPAVPAFLKHIGMTAFVEGWALYTEQLADEMGLYSGDLDRMGMLSYEAWRASRLVVDTGLHAMGWSREEAKVFMFEHTALAANNIDNEVDRYIVWPGQALAYKTGQMEIWRLRREAEKALGSSFDLKAFHDVVLGEGAVSLPVLRRQVEAWVARTKDP